MERRVPPAFFPRVMLRPAGVQPEGQAQAIPINPPRRRRPQGNTGVPYRAQNNDHCFNCGKSRELVIALCFRSVIFSHKECFHVCR